MTKFLWKYCGSKILLFPQYYVCIWFHKKSNNFAYFLLKLILRKIATLLVICFFLMLISRKKVNIVLFLSEIDFTKKYEYCFISFWNWFQKKKMNWFNEKSKNFEYLLLEIDLTFVQLMQHWIELSSSFLNSICTSIPDLLIKIQIGT